jgi:hypothetical protein
MQWSRPETSELWRANGWHDYEGEQDDRRVFTKTRKIPLLGREFTANLAYDTELTSFRHFTSISAVVPKADCETLANQFISRYGPSGMRDATSAVYFSETNFVRVVSLNFQWDIGPTRISAGCVGVMGSRDERKEDDGFIWSVRYSHLSGTPQQTPTFALRCSRQILFRDETAPRGLSDMYVIVDVDGGVMKNLNHSQMSDANSFVHSETEFSFRVTTKTAQTDYSINRISGALRATTTLDKKTMANISGMCEKTDVSRRKF